jgi:hypothetical protein
MTLLKQLERLKALCVRVLIADKSYHAGVLGEFIAATSSEVLIQPKKKRLEQFESERHLHRERRLVEWFSNKTVRNRQAMHRIFTDLQLTAIYRHVEETCRRLRLQPATQ